MNKVIILLTILLVTGCTPTTVKPKFPIAPDTLMEECPELITIDKPKVLLSELMTTVTKNYTTYHTCAIKVRAWQKWYNEQKKIYDSIK